MPEGQKLQFRKRILLFSIFLLISVFIWFLNALGRNYTAQIEYPLVYTDIPEDRVLVGDLPENLDLRINALGYALLRYKVLKKPVPVSHKISSYRMNHLGQDTTRAYVLTRYLKDQISSQLPPELQLLEIKPDTLHFQFAKRITRMVPVKPDLSFQLDKQFTTINGIQLNPDSVTVSGPDAILDTLRYISTERVDLGLLTKNYGDKIRLNKINGLELSSSRVDCDITLEKYTEVQLYIPIEVLGLPDTLSMQTFPSRIKFTCNVGLSKYDWVTDHLFSAVVDYSAVDEQKKEMLVSLQNIPSYLLNYEYYPRTVEFLISRK
jgi:hypothetical protein